MGINLLNIYKAPRSKYRSVKVNMCDHKKHISFPSILEADCYTFLCLLQKTFQISYFLRQVPFHLVGGIIYRVDFVIFLPNKNHYFLDIKGLVTRSFIDKKKMVEALYPIEILVLNKHNYKAKIMELLSN